MYSRPSAPTSANPPATTSPCAAARSAQPRDGRPVRGLGERAGLAGVAEHVARRDELGQHDDLRAGVRRGVERGERPRAVAVEIADAGASWQTAIRVMGAEPSGG